MFDFVAMRWLQQAINRYYRIDLYKQKENAQFSTIFGGWQLKCRFSNFPRFGQNVKKSELSQVSSLYLEEWALNYEMQITLD